MKFSHALIFLAAAGLFVAAPLACSVRAGSAVATDEHGGYGYSYGPQSEKELRRDAIRRCRAKSNFPEDVRIVVSTASQGAGIVLRYRVDGQRHIYAYVGAENAKQASEYAVSGARDSGAQGPIEVVAKWNDN